MFEAWGFFVQSWATRVVDVKNPFLEANQFYMIHLSTSKVSQAVFDTTFNVPKDLHRCEVLQINPLVWPQALTTHPGVGIHRAQRCGWVYEGPATLSLVFEKWCKHWRTQDTEAWKNEWMTNRTAEFSGNFSLRFHHLFLSGTGYRRCAKCKIQRILVRHAFTFAMSFLLSNGPMQNEGLTTQMPQFEQAGSAESMKLWLRCRKAYEHETTNEQSVQGFNFWSLKNSCTLLEELHHIAKNSRSNLLHGRHEQWLYESCWTWPCGYKI